MKKIVTFDYLHEPYNCLQFTRCSQIFLKNIESNNTGNNMTSHKHIWEVMFISNKVTLFLQSNQPQTLAQIH